jgi:predicted nucleic acid-binding protein
VPRQWVVNASPLIVLGKIGRLSLLPKLAVSLVVPSGVAEELAAGPETDPARLWIAGQGKDHVRDVAEADPVIGRWDLGRGESQVLTWALHHPGHEAILDDLAARRCAADLSIPVRGTLGIILLAKQEGHVAAVAPVIAEIQRAGLHINPDLIAVLRRLAGEGE